MAQENMQVLYPSMIEKEIEKLDELESKVCKMIVNEILESFVKFAKSFPVVKCFYMAMGSIFITVEYDMRIEDDEEDNDEVEPYFITRDISLHDFKYEDAFNDDKWILEVLKMDENEHLKHIIKLLNKYNERFKLCGEGVRVIRDNDFKFEYDW